MLKESRTKVETLKTFDHNFGGNTVSAPEGWIDTTEDVETENAPFTLAKKDDGIGALQFSFALYRGGQEPNIDITKLEEMLNDFASEKGLGQSFDKQIFESRLCIVASSYHTGSDLVRVWYCSDKRNVALATFVCDWEMRNIEVNECEGIVRSVQFAAVAPNGGMRSAS